MIYNLEREVASVTQGTMSVTDYFTKIKMLWDELVCLDPVPACICPAHRQIMIREDSRQLMRFLMGLNSTYEHVRSQILLMEPRPHVSKAFAMVISVEKQLQVQQPVTGNNAIYQLEHVESAGNLCCFHVTECGSWILDTGATRHVCASLNLFSHYQKAATSYNVNLPDGSKQPVAHIDTFDLSLPCDVCHFAKQQRLPFSRSTYQASSIFDLVHVDIWGPYKQATPTNCTYFLTIVDHHSRSTWTYLMHSKFQAIDHLYSFIKLVQTQFQKSIKVIRSDHGSEFLSNRCQSILLEHGIIHQKSCIYTPQQNGVVEHKHKHLITLARSLLFHASLPNKFWGDCVLTATYIIKRTPSKILQWSTPYQLLHNQPPTYDHMRVFGCLCYATNTKPTKSKFDMRSSKCVFLGYPSDQKAYKLFDLNTQIYLTSRDIVFYEHVFPFAVSPSSQPRCPLPLVFDADDVPN
ncbi:UNVERIFIED_CONTAM: Copia protein [Sesamum latifolium]|uniref:Copia protein n=1 Tax=Sesamum latifolium TaxID=2727402 RepID=A0AAW2XAT8_9LAMI